MVMNVMMDTSLGTVGCWGWRVLGIAVGLRCLLIGMIESISGSWIRRSIVELVIL